LFAARRERCVPGSQDEDRAVRAPGFEEPFAFDNFACYRLLEGLDDMDLMLTHEDDLEAFKRSRPGCLPSVL
jgi:3-isopropylmalate dehydratase small subunit